MELNDPRSNENRRNGDNPIGMNNVHIIKPIKEFIKLPGCFVLSKIRVRPIHIVTQAAGKIKIGKNIIKANIIDSKVVRLPKPSPLG
jgi:hypothetical protein